MRLLILTVGAFLCGPVAANAQAVWYCPPLRAYYPKVPVCPMPWLAVNLPRPVGPDGMPQTVPTLQELAQKEEQQKSDEARREGEKIAARFAEREREARERAIAAQRAEAPGLIAKYQKMSEDHGYKSVSFSDFKLDAKTLTENSDKVSVSGYYARIGEGEFLFPSQISYFMQIGQGPDPMHLISLLTTDAARNIRKYFMNNCNMLGCPVVILGKASICTRGTVSGEVEEPCISVDDGWNVPR
jgi:hypothetical protein